MTYAEDHGVRSEHDQNGDEAGEWREHARDDGERHGADPQRHAAGQLDHAAMQRDLSRDNARQAEQRRQVEHVGADHHSRADVRVVMDERRDRRSDLRRVGRERREHPQ